MNYAVIFAGGVGTRMNAKAKPKQFLEIHGKPVIIHTIEHFENHPQIDAICVVCVSDWMDYMKKLLKKYGVEKVRWVVPGRETALDSQYAGLLAIPAEAGKHVVLLHDGVRPLIDDKTITDCIRSVREYGSAITVAPANETIVTQDGNGMITDTYDRSKCLLARAPQCFWLDEILDAHKKSIEAGTHRFIDSASMMLSFGHKLHTVMGPAENLKVTAPADYYVCRALLSAREDSQLYGL